jgi:SOS response regulatory protein OraA/RecX
MEIVSSNISQKNSRLIWLKFSDGQLLPLSTDNYVLMHLKKFEPLNDELFLEIQTNSAKFLLTEYSLKQIAISPKVRKLLSQKLRQYAQKINLKFAYPHGLVSGLIEEVLNKITALGLLDEAKFVDYFARRHHRQSATQINYQLRQLGIDQKISTIDEVANIKAILEKKYQPIDFSDFKTKNKIIASLFRKGFALGDIKTAIDAFLGKLVKYP